MATHTLDARGLRCPQPILKMTIMLPQISPGDILEVQADCESFDEDVRKWCDRMRKTLLALNKNGDEVSAQIQF